MFDHVCCWDCKIADMFCGKRGRYKMCRYSFHIFVIFIPQSTICLIYFDQRTILASVIATWIKHSIIYTIRLEQFSHLRSQGRFFRLFGAIYSLKMLYSLAWVHVERKSSVSVSNISCLCFSMQDFTARPKQNFHAS